MKKSHALIGCCLLVQTAFAQPADSVLTAGLPNNNFMKLQKDGGFIIRGTFNPSYTGAPAQEGSGTRLLWFPQRAAFRAGTILETQWDGANIGDASVAIGYNNRLPVPTALLSASIAQQHRCRVSPLASRIQQAVPHR